jgi:hypothetical protein
MYNFALQGNRNLYGPIFRAAKNAQLHSEDGRNDSEDDDQFVVLQKRMRDLDFALESCQKGTVIPSVTLPVPAELIEAAKATSAAIITGHLDKYSATAVDQLFVDLHLSQGGLARNLIAFRSVSNISTSLHLLVILTSPSHPYIS